jgi:membrane-associated phospholipid phosphatase
MTPPKASIPTCRRRVWLVIIAGAVAIFAAMFLKLADSVRETDFVVRVDQHTMNFVLDHRLDWISRIARVVTQVGSTWVVTFVIVVAAAILIRRHRYLDAGFVAVSSIGTAILVAIAKQIIGRPRPAVSHRLVAATGAAFPSGHAAQSVGCYGALAVIILFATRTTKVRWSTILGAMTIVLLGRQFSRLPRRALAQRCPERMDARRRLAPHAHRRTPLPLCGAHIRLDRAWVSGEAR